VVDWDGLENRSRCKPTVGSNPTPSAADSPIVIVPIIDFVIVILIPILIVFTAPGSRPFGLIAGMCDEFLTRKRSAHTAPLQRKKLFGHMSLSYPEFRWAPD
jgi:hypothetical protein